MLNKIMETPEVIQRFQVNGLETGTSTPQGFGDIVRADLQTWSKLIKDANISIDSAQ